MDLDVGSSCSEPGLKYEKLQATKRVNVKGGHNLFVLTILP